MWGCLFSFIFQEEPAHQEFWGWDPNWGIFRVIRDVDCRVQNYYLVSSKRALSCNSLLCIFEPELILQSWAHLLLLAVSISETWEPPQFWKKRSRSEKAILGAILGIPGHSRSNSRNGTHDLIYVKTLFSEQLSERLSELVGRLNFRPKFSERFFQNWGGSRAPEYLLSSDSPHLRLICILFLFRLQRWLANWRFDPETVPFFLFIGCPQSWQKERTPKVQPNSWRKP